MTCPVCGEKSRCIGSKAECDVIYRKRKCEVCNYVFYTEEVEANIEDEYNDLMRDYWRRLKNNRME